MASSPDEVFDETEREFARMSLRARIIDILIHLAFLIVGIIVVTFLDILRDSLK